MKQSEFERLMFLDKRGLGGLLDEHDIAQGRLVDEAENFCEICNDPLPEGQENCEREQCQWMRYETMLDKEKDPEEDCDWKFEPKGEE